VYHSGVSRARSGRSAPVVAAKGAIQRRLHKAFLRYHGPENWPLLREALRRMGRAELIGSGPGQLVPAGQPLQSAKPPANFQKFTTKGIHR